MLTLTDNAIKAINRFIAGSETGANGLRIQVSDGGCSGMQYGLKLEQAAATEDVVVESNLSIVAAHRDILCKRVSESQQ